MLKIYVADLSPLENTQIYENVYNSLPESRRNKADRVKPVEGKRESIGAAWLLKYSLRSMGRENLMDRIVVDESGKPGFDLSALQDMEGSLYFNLSHTRGMAMCVLSSEPVGCDIQIMNRNSIKIAKRFYTEQEKLYVFEGLHNDFENDLIDINELEEDIRENICSRFYRVWVMKEAYVKLTGEGLSRDFGSFCVFDGDVHFHEFMLPKTQGLPDYSASYCCAVCSNTKIDDPTVETVTFDDAGRNTYAL